MQARPLMVYTENYNDNKREQQEATRNYWDAD